MHVSHQLPICQCVSIYLLANLSLSFCSSAVHVSLYVRRHSSHRSDVCLLVHIRLSLLTSNRLRALNTAMAASSISSLCYLTARPSVGLLVSPSLGCCLPTILYVIPSGVRQSVRLLLNSTCCIYSPLLPLH